MLLKNKNKVKTDCFIIYDLSFSDMISGSIDQSCPRVINLKNNCKFYQLVSHCIILNLYSYQVTRSGATTIALKLIVLDCIIFLLSIEVVFHSQEYWGHLPFEHNCGCLLLRRIFYVVFNLKKIQLVFHLQENEVVFHQQTIEVVFH